MLSTKEPQWIEVNNHALRFFGGVSAIVVCDNCKQAVTVNKDWIEPELNKDYAEWAEHNGTVILPAKVRRPTLLKPEYEDKTTKRFNNRLRTAHLIGTPCDISQCRDSSQRRYEPTDASKVLSTLQFIEDGLNVCILGPSDSGKTFLAKSLGVAACEKYRIHICLLHLPCCHQSSAYFWLFWSQRCTMSLHDRRVSCSDAEDAG